MTGTTSIFSIEIREAWLRYSTFIELENFIGDFYQDIIKMSMTIKMMILSLISSSHEVCPIAYSEELTYWGISELFVEPCCQELYYGRSAFIIIIFFTTAGLSSALMVLLSCVMIRMIIIMITFPKPSP